MKSLAFREMTEEEYINFVTHQQSDNFLQSIFAFRRYKQIGREAYLLGVARERRRERIVAAGLFVKTQEIHHRKIFSSPYGPILDYGQCNVQQILESFTAGAMHFLKPLGGSVLQISPYIPYSESLTKGLELLGYKNLGEYVQAKWISTLDLSIFSSPEELFRTFRKGHRYCIKYSQERYHIHIRQLERAELSILFDEVKKVADKYSFTAQEHAYYESMFDAFKDNVKVLAAFYEGRPIAAAMFVLYGDEVVYLYSGSDPQYAKVYGSYAIQWQMLRYCLENHISRYNFFGTRPFEDDGVYQFKAGFRAKIEELQGTFMLPLDVFGHLYVSQKKYRKFGQIQ